jgi:uncharacterized membrane protein
MSSDPSGAQAAAPPAPVDGTAGVTSSAPVSPRPALVDRTTAASRLAALACALGLIVLGVGWEMVWARTGHGTLVLKVLPLVTALPGLSRHRMYTYRWLALVVWLYVAEGALRLGDAPPVPALAALEIALGLALFAACTTQVRWRLASARQARGTVAERSEGHREA